jgi:hypothetical protein
MTERGVAILTNIARLRLASAAQLGALHGGASRMSSGHCWPCGKTGLSSDRRHRLHTAAS